MVDKIKRNIVEDDARSHNQKIAMSGVDSAAINKTVTGLSN